MPDLKELVLPISETQLYFKQQAQRQVNTGLRLRNGLFGFYIAECELNGADRAENGLILYKEIASQLDKQSLGRFAKGVCTSAKTFISSTRIFCVR